jgi:hypothetical protein
MMQAWADHFFEELKDEGRVVSLRRESALGTSFVTTGFQVQILRPAFSHDGASASAAAL